MKKLYLFVAMAAMSVCGSASAQIVSGKYILTIQTFCQPTLYVAYGELYSAVTGVGLAPGVHSNDMLLATFNPATQMASFKGFEDIGSVALASQPLAGGNAGIPFQENPVTMKPSPYSNTATTITMNGGTSNAIFGQIDKNGVTHYFTWQRIYTGDQSASCSVQGVASRQ